jgi:aminoglycoside phosphotransferase (APT) family kinase protein
VPRNLDKPHRIAPAPEARLREIVSSWPAGPVVLVPTHGDWQPRNWLLHEGRISITDFGRAAMQPALSDWLRLQALLTPQLPKVAQGREPLAEKGFAGL